MEKVNFQTCLKLYTKSLRYSTYNGEEYAMAFANRSAVYFALKDYKVLIMTYLFLHVTNFLHL